MTKVDKSTHGARCLAQREELVFKAIHRSALIKSSRLLLLSQNKERKEISRIILCQMKS